MFVHAFVHDLEPNAKANGPRVHFSPGVCRHPWAERRARSLAQSPTRWAELIMAGTGAMRPALEARGCTVLGWVNRHQPAVLPTRGRPHHAFHVARTFGLVGLEALTMGTSGRAQRRGARWHPGGPGLAPWGDVWPCAIVAVAGTTPPPARL